MKKIIFSICVLSFLIFSCTFNYAEGEDSERTLPDLLMVDVEYIRVRSADPLARVLAERVERFEGQGIMRLENFSFEQFGGERGEEVNAFGRAGFASVDITTVDVFMDRGVRIEVESEDFVIETNQLNWIDEQRHLFAGEGNEVFVFRGNGTSFTGIGFRADARRRTMEFSSSVRGTYIHEDDAGDAE
jgi:LPS export ABC transporter protein LptC